ncbi:family 10 glycosylhydrolase [Barnesiella propionica]|uniref:glycoside hydrolase family 10 protein n=1 Tax=Barnesiella propionica TaxID=2981781 RepID=UPI0011CC2E4D|nr:family 10 glycosylhydrolase [Barnesiella propionica]MCU6770081.1 family 10 glycosylhydrolase [Barnesiella propionica]
MKKIILLFLSLLAAAMLIAQPKQEIRAVWLATNPYALDWPKSVVERSQKDQLITILDKLEAANFNTVIFQVQSYGDVLWDSGIQPWCYHLTGTPGKAPAYDMCQYVIDECHKRNMEVHAWVVPYRVGSLTYVTKYDNCDLPHVTKVHPELCIQFGNDWYLDPGLPKVREYLLNLYETLIKKYDFDGLNLDYTRYPSKTFNDAVSYAEYGNGKNKSDWRRENINQFVYELYDMVKSIKPEMKIGSAPIGTYKNISGLRVNAEGYGDYFQDACDWAKKGKQDLLIPQMYWNETYNYSKHMVTWMDNRNDRQLVIGLAPYKIVDESKWDVSVVTDQIEKARKNNPETCGVCFFKIEDVTGSPLKIRNFYNQLKDNYFKYPAHIPVMPYHGITKPNAPVGLSASVNDDNRECTLTWNIPSLDNEGTPIRYYSVYMSENSDIDINDVTKQIGHIVKDNTFTCTLPEVNKDYYLAVTTFDRGYYESDLSDIVKVSAVSGIIETGIKPVKFILAGDWLKVETEQKITSVGVYALSGVLVAYSASYEMNVANLPHGAYIVMVTMENGKVVKHKMIR